MWRLCLVCIWIEWGGSFRLLQYSGPSLLLLFVRLPFCKVLGDILRVAGHVRDAPSSFLHLVSSEALPPSNAELRKGLSQPRYKGFAACQVKIIAKRKEISSRTLKITRNSCRCCVQGLRQYTLLLSSERKYIKLAHV